MELIQVDCEFLHAVPRVVLQCPYDTVKIMIGTDLDLQLIRYYE